MTIAPEKEILRNHKWPLNQWKYAQAITVMKEAVRIVLRLFPQPQRSIDQGVGWYDALGIVWTHRHSPVLLAAVWTTVISLEILIKSRIRKPSDSVIHFQVFILNPSQYLCQGGCTKVFIAAFLVQKMTTKNSHYAYFKNMFIQQ